MPSGGTTKLAQIWFDALSSVQRQTAVLPQAVPRFWHVVFVPGGSGEGGGGAVLFFFFFFFFFASAVAIKPSDARAPAARPPRPRRDSREFTVCVIRSNCSPSTAEFLLHCTSRAHLAERCRPLVV